MSEGLNQTPPPEQEGNTKYAVVRAASGLSTKEMPDELIHSIYTYAGDQCKNPYELAVFVHQAHKYQLSPIAGEIFAFRTRNGFKVYAGRDGFVKAAERSPSYNGHQAAVVFEKDEFSIEIDGRDVTVHHKINGIERGEPIGAYCVAYGKDRNPVVVIRKWKDWEYLWSDSKKFNWKSDPIGMGENRIIRAGLTRIVPLGGLGIQGDQEDDLESWVEDRMGKSTRSKADELRAKLGLDPDPEPEKDDVPEAEFTVVDPEEAPAPEELSRLFYEAMEHHMIPTAAVEAWAHRNASVPDDPDDWKEAHVRLALQEIRDTQGRDFLQEYARELASKADLGFDERQELEDELVQLTTDNHALLRIIERLEERVPIE